MAKFYGMIGFGDTVEQPADSGVWVDQITERPYYGDVIRNARTLRDGEVLNNDLTVSNSISVVADAYFNENFHHLRYILWMGKRWHVTDVEVQAPRLILRLGGVYNGPVPPPAAP